MLGKTHMAVGIAAGIAIFQPDSVMTAAVCTAGTALGALIPDIDVGHSKSRNKVQSIIGMTILITVTLATIEAAFHIGIYRQLMSNSSVVRILSGFAVFLIACGYGLKTSHRSFMHSFMAGAILTVCVYIIFPMVAEYFAVGFCSHLIIDLLNHRGEQLLFPCKKRFCLDIASSHGLINEVLFAMADVIILLYCIVNIQEKFL